MGIGRSSSSLQTFLSSSGAEVMGLDPAGAGPGPPTSRQDQLWGLQGVAGALPGGVSSWPDAAPAWCGELGNLTGTGKDPSLATEVWKRLPVQLPRPPAPRLDTGDTGSFFPRLNAPSARSCPGRRPALSLQTDPQCPAGCCPACPPQGLQAPAASFQQTP